jgi:hypothetical protein
MELLRRELRSPYKLLDRIGLILQRDLNQGELRSSLGLAMKMKT